MFKWVLLNILSQLRFVFYPFITFPDPLEYHERRSSIARREREVKEREDNAHYFRSTLVTYQKALGEYHKSLDPLWDGRSGFATRNKVQELRQQIKDPIPEKKRVIPPYLYL